MQLQWKNRPCPYLQTRLRQSQNLEQTLELRLPEELPDIGRVICAWGQCVVRSKQWRGDSVHVSGGVTASVLYMPEDGSGLKCVEGWLPFQTKWGIPQSRREGTIRVCCLVQEVDARVLSARKMMLRAEIGLLAEALEPMEAELYTPGEVPAGVEVLNQLYPAVLPAEAGEKQISLEEQLDLPGISKWIHICLQPELTEQSVVGSRVVMRGMCRLQYFCLDEVGQLRSGSRELPLAQFAELDRDYDDGATADVQPCLSSLEWEQTEGGCLVRCGITAQYLIKEQTLLEVTEDAYSPTCQLSLDTVCLTLPMELDSRQQVLNADMDFWEGQLVDMDFLPGHPKEYREGDTIHLEVPGQFRCRYWDAEGNLQQQTQNWTGSLTLPAAENTHLQAAIADTELSGNGAAVKLQLNTWADQQIPMVSGITVGEQKPRKEDRPSLLLRPMDADSLWQLAKASGSTMDAIRKANQLTQDPQPGQMLLIPVI